MNESTTHRLAAPSGRRPARGSSRCPCLPGYWLIAVLAAACGSEAGGGTRWLAEIDTVGDTIIVRTLSGGEWGSTARLVPDVRIGVLEGDDEYLLGNVTGLAVGADGAMYIHDAQVPAVRKYDAAGQWVATFGRSGGGPGEYKSSDGGMAVLPDGRIVLRDQGNARFQLWTPDGEPAGEWRYMGGFFTSTPLFVDTAGSVYSSIVDFSAPPLKTLLIRYVNGEPADTTPVPEWDYEPAEIIAQSIVNGEPQGTAINPVPFAPDAHWTLSPFGYFVGGLSTRYAVDLYRPEGVLRIGRSIEPVAVDPDEKADHQAYATDNMRGMVPDWKWNGPPIPDTKPPFTLLIAAQDGRIWVKLSQPGERIPDNELDEPRPDGRRRQSGWREPVAFDVFEPDGRYVGMVRGPRGLRTHPRPVIRGDTMWAIITDALGVQQLTRLVVNAGPDTGQ